MNLLPLYLKTLKDAFLYKIYYLHLYANRSVSYARKLSQACMIAAMCDCALWAELEYFMVPNSNGNVGIYFKYNLHTPNTHQLQTRWMVLEIEKRVSYWQQDDYKCRDSNCRLI